MTNPKESRPLPDPTLLTTQQLQREISLQENAVNTRFDGMDKAIELLQKFADKSPTMAVLEQQIGSVTLLVEEKFNGVEKQFAERDKRTEQLSLADKTAIAAALQAQKEAAGAQAESNAASTAKQELAFTKLLEQIQQTQSAMNKSTDDKINALTGRLDRGEGHSKGMGDGWGYIVGAVGVLAAVAAVITLILKVAAA